jgi:2-succinyl-6-hydroxy-2,4-cyclohexadiene-1-carboxylate synthase
MNKKIDSLHLHFFGAQIDPNKLTVLWIHGYTLNGSIWKQLVEELPQWNHIAVDLPGHGKSRLLTLNDDLLTVSDDVRDIANKFNVSHIVGLSFGGIIAIQVANLLGTQLKSLVLAASGLGGGPTDVDATERNMELIDLYNKRGDGPWMTDLWLSSPPDIFKGVKKHPELYDSIKQQIENHSWEELNNASMQKICQYSQINKELKGISATTLLLVGEEDMTVFKRTSQLIMRSIKNCKRCYLADAGHLCLLEQPKTSADLIQRHFDSQK